MYDGRYLSIPIVEYTIISHVYAYCMYVFIYRKNTLYILLGHKMISLF